MDGLRVNDPHPRINAYVIGHEGVSDVLVGGQRTPVTWIRRAIEWINEKVQLFIPAYMGHGAPGDNSDQGRQTVGEIVGKKLTEIGDKVATVLAVYIYPQFRDTVLDVASIEADVSFERDGVGMVRPVAVNRVTGIALGNSSVSRPGFPGATLIGALQAFAESRDSMQTVAEVVAAAKALGIKPSDMFPVEDIMKDTMVEAKVKEAKHDVYNQNIRLQNEVDELKGKIVSTTEKYEGELKTLKTQTVLSKAETLAGTIMGERKLSDKAQTYVRKQLKRFKSEAADEDKLKVDLNKFIDEAQVDYRELLKDMGLPEDKPTGDTPKPGDEGVGVSGKPDTSKPVEPDGSVPKPFAEFTSAKTNPLLVPDES
jgi:hypothetical protein